MSDASISYIENLPNEIFLQIFGYFCLDELCQVWGDLNYRINSILQSARSCLCITSNEDVDEYEEYLQKWSEMVIFLDDCRDEWTAWSSYYKEFEPIDLAPFVNLRKFSQRDNSAGQLEQICPKDFPHLECLHLSDYSLNTNDDSRILFDDQFPLLASISGVFLTQELVDGTTINTIIRRISVCTNFKRDSFTLLINLIQRLPNLTTLRVKAHDFKSTSLPSKITTKIRNLSVWNECNATLEEIEFLLQVSPVKRLYLEIGSECITGPFKSCDFIQLAQILNNCQTLKHVELRVWRLDRKFDLTQIRQLSPWFTALDLEYGYENRKSLQTYHYRFKDKHLRL